MMQDHEDIYDIPYFYRSLTSGSVGIARTASKIALLGHRRRKPYQAKA
jgi:hypothetical protein